MSFSSQKGEFDRFFNRLDRPVKESRPDRQPDRPVDPTGFHLCPISLQYNYRTQDTQRPTLNTNQKQIRTDWFCQVVRVQIHSC